MELVKADIRYSDEILAYRNDFLQSGDSMDGTGMLRGSETAEEYISWCERLGSPATCPEGRVPSTQFFAVEDGHIVGMIDLRHHIDHPTLSVWGGHIGYSVRPQYRRRGYATEMLRRVLKEAKAMGIKKALVTCMDGNIASEKTILANGGEFERTVITEEGPVKRFWITTDM